MRRNFILVRQPFFGVNDGVLKFNYRELIVNTPNGFATHQCINKYRNRKKNYFRTLNGETIQINPKEDINQDIGYNTSIWSVGYYYEQEQAGVDIHNDGVNVITQVNKRVYKFEHAGNEWTVENYHEMDERPLIIAFVEVEEDEDFEVPELIEQLQLAQFEGVFGTIEYLDKIGFLNDNLI